ncbi:DeoR/GlpR family DNA-binding transcription regulator [Agromyces intestinalis]|uniref:DeoR/GlpR family DNA-binding transcription regulator n=1 Tax=Agromyces intestinalis TaxID=2592652 RepID=UPI00143DDB8C|nr:DeoR/GlpR family DNA-binding transcription regulator [Agromyces intestinalis]
MNEERFRYTSAPERRERLLQYIAEQGYCTIAELSKAFSVSEMTIRRDAQKLVEQELVRGFRGGVGSLSKQDLTGSDYRFRDIAHAAAKHAIASAAVGMVEPHSVVAIDAGTTANQFAQLLPADRDIKVITNSFPALASLVGNPGVEVSCLGGTLHPESLSFDGPATLAGIENIQIQTLFLAASGMSDRGAFCANGFDAITKRALIDVSERVVLLADSTKFDAHAMVRICDWDVVDRLIVDDGISEAQQHMLRQQGVQVEVVPVNESVEAVS